MIDLIPEYFVKEPRRLITLGHGLISAGSIVLLAGAAGRVGTTAVSLVQSLSSQPSTEATLAVLYPGLPTWWIPESVVGCVPAVVAITAGFALLRLGRMLIRTYW